MTARKFIKILKKKMIEVMESIIPAPAPQLAPARIRRRKTTRSRR